MKCYNKQRERDNCRRGTKVEAVSRLKSPFSRQRWKGIDEKVQFLHYSL